MRTQKQTKPTKLHSDIGLDDIQINHLFYDQTSLSPTFAFSTVVSLSDAKSTCSYNWSCHLSNRNEERAPLFPSVPTAKLWSWVSLWLIECLSLNHWSQGTGMLGLARPGSCDFCQRLGCNVDVWSVAEPRGLKLGEIQLPKGKLTCCCNQQEGMPTRQKEQMFSQRHGRFLGVGLG